MTTSPFSMIKIALGLFYFTRVLRTRHPRYCHWNSGLLLSYSHYFNYCGVSNLPIFGLNIPAPDDRVHSVSFECKFGWRLSKRKWYHRFIDDDLQFCKVNSLYHSYKFVDLIHSIYCRFAEEVSPNWNHLYPSKPQLLPRAVCHNSFVYCGFGQL